MRTTPEPHTMLTVSSAIARHLDVDPASVELHHDLRDELGLDALDLVLILTRVEEELDTFVSLPHLEYVRTVADLVAVVEDEDEPPTLRDPGIWGTDDARPA